MLSAKAENALRERSHHDQIFIQVGSATCEHAAGSRDVLDEFRKHIAASGRNDIVLHQTGCTGRCSREPIVGVMVPGQMPVKYERVDRALVHEIFTPHVLKGEPLLDRVLDGPIEKLAQYELLVCGSARCGWKGQKLAKGPLAEKLEARGIGQTRSASRRPVASARAVRKRPADVHPPAGPARQGALSRQTTKPTWTRSSSSTSSAGRSFERLRVPEEPVGQQFFELYGDVAFFNRQSRVALRHNGVIDPDSIEEYFHYRGFQALAKVLEQGRSAVGDRGDHAIEAPRPRRRRISDRPEMGDGRRGRRQDPLPHLQRRRRRPRRVHGPQHVGNAIRSTWSRA